MVYFEDYSTTATTRNFKYKITAEYFQLNISESLLTYYCANLNYCQPIDYTMHRIQKLEKTHVMCF